MNEKPTSFFRALALLRSAVSSNSQACVIAGKPTLVTIVRLAISGSFYRVTGVVGKIFRTKKTNSLVHLIFYWSNCITNLATVNWLHWLHCLELATAIQSNVLGLALN